MSRIWQITPGDRAAVAGRRAGGRDTRLELTALPGGGMALALAGGGRRRPRSCSGGSPAARSASCRRPRRAWLVGAAGARALLAIAVMLVEPVLVSSHRETVRSHLPIIVDDSESMRFSDPYTDETRRRPRPPPP